MALHRIVEAGGEPWLGFAQTRLADIMRRRKLGDPSTVHSYTPEGVGGVQIQIRVGTEQQHIHIKPGDQVEVLSGLTTPSWIQKVTLAGDVQDALFNFFPSSLQAAQEKKPRAWRSEPKLAVEASPENKREASPAHTWGQTADVAPAMFTGQMVGVAQLAMGLRRNQIQYQHGFYCTHGVYMDGATPWLIEISQAHGVLAKKLTGYKKSTSKVQDAAIKTHFPLIPDGVAFPSAGKLSDALNKGTVRRLLGPAAVAPFYANDPFFADCGWAFNQSGTVALNTATSWPDLYKRGHLFQISIAGAPGLGPQSASITELEQGYLWCHDDASRVCFPTGTGNQLFTFPMKPEGFTPPPPVDGPWTGPLYAFFVGDAAQIYRQQNFYGLVDARVAGWLPFDPFAGASTPNSASDTGGTFLDAGAYNVQCENSTANARVDQLDFSGPGIAPPVVEPGRVYTKRFMHVEDTGPNYVDFTSVSIVDPNAHWTRSDVSCALAEEESGTTGGISETNAIAISPKNRSCVFVARYAIHGERVIDKKDLFLGALVRQGATYDKIRLAATGGGFEIYESGDTGPTSPGAILSFVVLGYHADGAFPPATMTNVPGTNAVSTSIKLDIANTETLTADFSNPSHVGHVYPTETTPESILTTWAHQNGPYSGSRAVSAGPERDAFFTVMAVTPTLDETYATVASGRSAYLGSHFECKVPGAISGAGLQTSAGDGEDMTALSVNTSWVGLQ